MFVQSWTTDASMLRFISMTWPSHDHAEKHSGSGFKTNLRDNHRGCDWLSELQCAALKTTLRISCCDLLRVIIGNIHNSFGLKSVISIHLSKSNRLASGERENKPKIVTELFREERQTINVLITEPSTKNYT